MLKGQKTKLWAPLDLAKIPNHKNLLPLFVHKYPDGKVDGIGAVSWYITLVSNTKVFPEAPTSWADMWDADKKDKLGLLALASNSFLLEVTATTFFGGTKVLDTKEGIQKVLDKLAELKPNVKLWYRDEAQFEQALKSGEIPMGQYYHDVATLAQQGPPGALDLPEGGRRARLGFLGGHQGLQEDRGSPCVHQLHVPPGHPGRSSRSRSAPPRP